MSTYSECGLLPLRFAPEDRRIMYGGAHQEGRDVTHDEEEPEQQIFEGSAPCTCLHTPETLASGRV